MKYWYNPNPCFGKPIFQSHSLSHPHRQPNPLPSLLWRAPGWRLAGLRPNITTRPLCPPSMQQNRNSRPCFFCDWTLVCATSYNGSGLSDVLCWKYLGAVSCSTRRWISRITPQHRATFQKYQKWSNALVWKQQKVCTGKVFTKWSCDPWDTVESNQPPPKTDISLPSSAATETTLRPNIPFDHFWDNNSFRPSHVCYNVLLN